jgi:hypothetical protein
MDLLAQRGPLAGLRGISRTNLLDHRAPLLSPVTPLAMLLRAIGFRWYGAEKTLADGSKGITCFLDTTTLHSDQTQSRRVAWSFRAGDRMPLGGDPVSIVQVAHFFDASLKTPEKPILPGAAAVLRAIRGDDPDLWSRDMPFNERGRRLLHSAAMCGQPEAKRLLLEVVELYRGYVWKLSTPAGHPPHPLYGSPLERHLRYRKGKRVGDVRASTCKDERMEELRMFGLR